MAAKASAPRPKQLSHGSSARIDMKAATMNKPAWTSTKMKLHLLGIVGLYGNGNRHGGWIPAKRIFELLEITVGHRMTFNAVTGRPFVLRQIMRAEQAI